MPAPRSPRGWRARPPPDRARTSLAAVARDAVDVLSREDPRRLRECAAHDCSRVFLDRSRPGMRRWCDSAGCGNRDKTSAYRRRRKQLDDSDDVDGPVISRCGSESSSFPSSHGVSRAFGGSGLSNSASRTPGPTTTSHGAALEIFPEFCPIPTLTAAALATEGDPTRHARRLAQLPAPAHAGQGDRDAGRHLGWSPDAWPGPGKHGDWDATMMGAEPWSPRDRRERFLEIVELTDFLLREPETTYVGNFYSARMFAPTLAASSVPASPSRSSPPAGGRACGSLPASLRRGSRPVDEPAPTGRQRPRQPRRSRPDRPPTKRASKKDASLATLSYGSS